MSLRVDAVAPSLFPLPPLFPLYRRVSCRCGCGLWFYAVRAKGRPPAYVNEEHYRRERNSRRNRRHQHAALVTDGGHAQPSAQRPSSQNTGERP